MNPQGKVLLVEDNACNRAVIEDMFEFDDIPAALVSVESGEEALQVAPELQPVLILMDVGLPGIDGLTATRELKANSATREIPVWALTAHAMQGDRDRVLSAGCSQYFTKPIRAREFAEGLREFLTSRPT
jgi:CheY-like chemotaxis protein